MHCKLCDGSFVASNCISDKIRHRWRPKTIICCSNIEDVLEYCCYFTEYDFSICSIYACRVLYQISLYASNSAASQGSNSILRIEVEQIDNENNDRWSGEFTSQCKLSFITSANFLSIVTSQRSRFEMFCYSIKSGLNCVLNPIIVTITLELNPIIVTITWFKPYLI